MKLKIRMTKDSRLSANEDGTQYVAIPAEEKYVTVEAPSVCEGYCKAIRQNFGEFSPMSHEILDK